MASRRGAPTCATPPPITTQQPRVAQTRSHGMPSARGVRRCVRRRYEIRINTAFEAVIKAYQICCRAGLLRYVSR